MQVRENKKEDKQQDPAKKSAYSFLTSITSALLSVVTKEEKSIVTRMRKLGEAACQHAHSVIKKMADTQTIYREIIDFAGQVETSARKKNPLLTDDEAIKRRKAAISSALEACEYDADQGSAAFWDHCYDDKEDGFKTDVYQRLVSAVAQFENQECFPNEYALTALLFLCEQMRSDKTLQMLDAEFLSVADHNALIRIFVKSDTEAHWETDSNQLAESIIVDVIRKEVYLASELPKRLSWVETLEDGAIPYNAKKITAGLYVDGVCVAGFFPVFYAPKTGWCALRVMNLSEWIPACAGMTGSEAA